MFDLITAVVCIAGTCVAFRTLHIIDPSIPPLSLPRSWRRFLGLER